MLRLLALTTQVALIVLAGYNALIALWGWPDRELAPVGSRRRKVRVVIPAHNEERVVSNVLGDLALSDYPTDLVDVWVIADRCTDGTAEMARESGAHVAERSTGSSGKGAALSWYLDIHPLTPEEALVVFDADNRVPPEAIGRIVDELDHGHGVAQCYLDVVDPDKSVISQASALSYWAGNRMVQLARSNLGWSADLGGTGMAFTAEALARAGGFTQSLTEDQELGIRLVLQGERVEWLHDIRIRDEKPTSVGVTVRQRARWMAGKREARRKHLGALIGKATPASLDQAVRLVQPGRSFVALLSGLLTIAAVMTGSSWFLSWQVWAVATAVQVLEPIPFLAKEGVEAKRLLKYPLLVLVAALWIPVRVMSQRLTGWYHTPHEGPSP